ncbi:MAG TPA: TIGR03435 family protein [Bryobacteraceae bacterium]|nr:TIGR03435 family protein [Bryobacteraceae bacterium]
MRVVKITIAAAASALALVAQSSTFDVASVKPNKSNDPPQANMPIGPGDVYTPTGGYFNASNFPLVTYIFFAYKIKGNQGQYLLEQLPDWVKTERFDIQARASGNPSKDAIRMMMRTLLTGRFKLAIHTEAREVPVLAFVLAKPGKMGPQLRQHSPDSPCSTATPSPAEQAAAPPQPLLATVDGGFPALCNGIFGMPPTVPGQQRVGARNVTLAFIADSLSASAGLGRPMVDQTGLAGSVDFLLEWTPDNRNAPQPGAEPNAESNTLTLEQALRDQLGIKLESRKGNVDVLVVDHIERPSEN